MYSKNSDKSEILLRTEENRSIGVPLSDDELAQISGGIGGGKVCPSCGSNQIAQAGGGKYKCMDCGTVF